MKKNLLRYLLIFVLLLMPIGGFSTTAEGRRAVQAVEFSQHTIDADLSTYSLHAINLDGDSDIDIVAVDQPVAELGQLLWFENTGGQSFNPHTIDANFDYAKSVYVANLDNDTDLDIVAVEAQNQWGTDQLAWWQNDGSENFSKEVLTDTLIGNWVVYAVDLDQDTDMDILDGAVGGFYYWENDGNGNFTSNRIDSFEDDFNADSLYPADLDGDTDIDVAATAGGETTWWENDGSESFTKHTLESTSSTYEHRVFAIDLDSDTDIDLLTTVEENDEIAWWENNGSGGFTKHVIDSSFDTASAVSAADMDSDGDIDVLGATSWHNGIAWWENDGSESFTKHEIDATGAAEVLQAIDMDGDLDLDLVIGDSVDGLIWWEQLGSPSGVAKQAHYRIGGDTAIDNMSWYELVDTPATDMAFETNFRVRFQIYNDGTLDYNWQPRLEWSESQGSGYAPVPTSSGVPSFYIADTTHYSDATAIPSADFGLGSGIGSPQDGVAYDVSNPPGTDIILSSGYYTEIEFNLRANSRADYGTTYYFRLTDAGNPLDAYPVTAQITMEGAPGIGTVTGKVVDQNNQALSNINVNVDWDNLTITNGEGIYTLELSAGTYEFYFDQMNTYWDNFEDVTVIADQTVEKNIVLIEKDGCLSGDTNCALSLVSMFPLVGTIAELSQVASAASELCEIGSLYNSGDYGQCAAKMALWLASVAKIPILSQLLDLSQGIDTITCVTQRLESVGKTAGKYALTFWDTIYQQPNQDTVVVFQLVSSGQTRSATPLLTGGIDFELTDSNGRKLSLVNGEIAERSILGSFALDSDQGFVIGMVNQNNADFTLSFEGTTTGNYDLDVILPQNGISVKLTYSNLSITPQTNGTLIVASDNDDYSLLLDFDGDGIVDETRQPNTIEESQQRIFLPLTLR